VLPPQSAVSIHCVKVQYCMITHHCQLHMGQFSGIAYVPAVVLLLCTLPAL
jgi:hypothetical protein